jgi:hypothetical protein
MSGFKTLKIVDVDWLTLVANEEEVINDAEKDEPLSQGFFHEAVGDKLDPDVTAALPATIRHLKLNRFPQEEISSIIRLLRDKEKDTAAPELTNITLRLREGPRHSWEEVNEIAGRVEVTID